jgi:hypothetical protein
MWWCVPTLSNGMRKGKVFVGSLAMNQRSIDGKDKRARNIVNLYWVTTDAALDTTGRLLFAVQITVRKCVGFTGLART